MADQERVTQILRELVERESVSPALAPGGQGELVVATYVDDFCRRLGLEVQQQEVFPGRPNVIARLRVPGSRGALLFEAHTDTVPAGDMPDAFTPRVIGDKLYGRGACDTKGSLAAMLHALELLCADVSALPCDILLLAAASEENSLAGAAAFVELGLPVDASIVGEPTDLAVIVAHKGVARFRLTVEGREGHTSTPNAEDNAIYQAAEVVRALRAYAEETLQQRRHPLVGEATLTVSRIRGGEVLNVVPGLCHIDIDRRTLPGEDPERTMEEVDAVLAELISREPWVRVRRSEIFQLVRGMETPADHPVVSALQSACAHLGLSATLRGVPYGTDASMLAGKGGIPSVVFGPGHIGQAHTRDEYVSLPQVAAAADVLVQTAQSFTR